MTTNGTGRKPTADDMMTTPPKHTPGPWITSEWRDDNHGEYKEVGAFGGSMWIADVRGSVESGNGSSNARLIAAAPELLEACTLIAAGPVDEPQIDLVGDWEKGLFCGLEDKGFQCDGYAACVYGFEAGVERVLKWAQGIVHEPIAKVEKGT